MLGARVNGHMPQAQAAGPAFLNVLVYVRPSSTLLVDRPFCVCGRGTSCPVAVPLSRDCGTRSGVRLALVLVPSSPTYAVAMPVPGPPPLLRTSVW